jgi:hypothetical protein
MAHPVHKEKSNENVFTPTIQDIYLDPLFNFTPLTYPPSSFDFLL